LDFCAAVSPLHWVPVPDHAAAIVRCGFACVEVTYLSFPHWDADRCAEMRERLAADGLTVNSVHLPFGSELNVLNTDPVVRLHALEAHRSVMRGSVGLGADIVVLHPGREYRSERPLSDILAACREVLRTITDLAVDLDLQVALENVLPAHALSPAELLREMVDEIDDPHLGFCLDTGHAHVVGSVEAVLDAFAGRVKHVHIHDNHGAADEHLLPSLGSIQWDGFVDRLLATGYTGPLTLECYPPAGIAPEEMLPLVRGALNVR